MIVRPPRTREEIAAWLVKVREASPYSQRKLAGTIELSERRLRRWEEGQIPDGVVQMMEILTELGVNLALPDEPTKPLEDGSAAMLKAWKRRLEDQLSALQARPEDRQSSQ